MGILVNESQIGGGSSNTSHNIGDIFYTTRTDNSLNGAVECNGSQYNFSDFDSNLQSLFDEGKLPYVSIGKFDSMVTNQGGCDSFGYGTDTKWTSWEEMSDYVYTNKASTHAEVGDPVYDAPGGNIIGYITRVDDSDRTTIYYDGNDGASGFGYYYDSVNGPVDSTPYFKVPKKLGRVLVRTQKPTADNDYTWYNLYADGWCEQGGKGISVARGTITFPIEMYDGNYCLTFGGAGATSNYNTNLIGGFSRETTGFTIQSLVVNNTSQTSGTNSSSSTWQVSGYADPAEYTKDKWNYQNIQVERCMVQLFNSTTDTAVATCNQVLADVSALNQGDYVIETQIPTPENNYTWYRLYKSGWVEQGKTTSIGNLSDGQSSSVEDTFIITMANTNYQVIATPTAANYSNRVFANFGEKTTTGLLVGVRNIGGTTNSITVNWQVSGMSAQGKK